RRHCEARSLHRRVSPLGGTDRSVSIEREPTRHGWVSPSGMDLGIAELRCYTFTAWTSLGISDTVTMPMGASVGRPLSVMMIASMDSPEWKDLSNCSNAS